MSAHFPTKRPPGVTSDEWRALLASGIDGGGENGSASYTLMDINGDGQRDLIIDTYSGGTGLFSYVGALRREGGKFAGADGLCPVPDTVKGDDRGVYYSYGPGHYTFEIVADMPVWVGASATSGNWSNGRLVWRLFTQGRAVRATVDAQAGGRAGADVFRQGLAHRCRDQGVDRRGRGRQRYVIHRLPPLAARQPDHSLISTSMLVMVGKCLSSFRLTVNATPLRLPAMKPVLPSRSDTASCSGGVSCL